MSDIPEAPASLNIRFASQMGFECSLTLRSFDEEAGGLTLLGKLGTVEEKLHKKGCNPIFGKNSQPQARDAEPEETPKKKPCPVHPGKFLYLRSNEEGGEWYSHKVGDEWCRGE
jgi:hypothetical protein